MFNTQGEDVNWKQMRKEQVKMTERDLKGQMDENIRRQEREKDRGNKKKHKTQVKKNQTSELTHCEPQPL